MNKDNIFIPKLSTKENSMRESQKLSGQLQKKSFQSKKTLDANLVIKTFEGDIVSLSANTESMLNAFMYNNKGVISKSGENISEQNNREIILTNSETFSFSVIGDLSQEELLDIESIVRGMDEIITQMTQGEISKAIEKAFAIGSYDTIAIYSVDIAYQQSYEFETQTAESIANNELLPLDDTIIPFVSKQFPENCIFPNNTNNLISNTKEAIEQIRELFEKYETDLVGTALKPIDKLFSRHFQTIKQSINDKSLEIKDEKVLNQAQKAAQKAIETTRTKVEIMINEMVKKAFSNYLKSLSKHTS